MSPVTAFLKRGWKRISTPFILFFGLLRRNITPTSLSYLLAHVVVFLFGIVVISVGLPLISTIDSLSRIGTPLTIGAGTSLIAAGVTGWALFVYIVVSKERFGTIELLTEHGLKSAYKDRGPNKKEVYTERLNSARKRIDIMAFGLDAFRNDCRDYFAEWEDRRSLEVRILLIDPNYPTPEYSFARQRDKEEGSGRIRKDVERFIEVAEKELPDDVEIHENDSSFKIKLYRCLPNVTVFRIDNEIIWGPYTVKDQSRNMPAFIVGNYGHLFKYFENHFEKIWNDDKLSRTVPEDWREKFDREAGGG